MKLEELAEQVGLSKSALGSYENDEDKEINHGSLLKLAGFYQVTVDYLLGLTDNRAHENTPLAELHLTDEAVALLKSGRVNNRLLCEIVAHDKFAELLADAEIYVDGMATMRFHDMNTALAAVRAMILEAIRSRRRPLSENLGSRTDTRGRFFLPCDAQNMGRHSARHSQSP